MSLVQQIVRFDNDTSDDMESNENSFAGKMLSDERKIKCIPFSDNQNADNIQSVIQETQGSNSKKRKGLETRTKTPVAVAVARRNARERNRVKQVNNGFASLRQHIPESIAKCFEEVSTKNSAKKLSKVETLRMAVEYIRQLESMLGDTQSNTSLPAPETPPPETSSNSSQSGFYEIKPTFKGSDTEIAIINGQQYVRIPGTNTFQLITIHTTTVGDEDETKPDLSVLNDLCLVQSFSQSSMDSEMFSFSSDICMEAIIPPPLMQNIKEEPDYI